MLFSQLLYYTAALFVCISEKLLFPYCAREKSYVIPAPYLITDARVNPLIEYRSIHSSFLVNIRYTLRPTEKILGGKDSRGITCI